MSQQLEYHEDDHQQEEIRNMASITYSNDMNDCMKTRCLECSKTVTLYTLDKHTRGVHGLSIRDYRLRWGDPRLQVQRVVLHTCRFCSQDLHMDHNVLMSHMRSHNITFQEYSRLHLVPSKTDPYKAGNRGVSSPSNSSPLQLLQDDTKVVSMGPSFSPLRGFKKKKPLKLRHKLMSMEDSLAASRRRSCDLGSLVLALETRQRREAQALAQLVRLLYC